jgi:hypothetical protein
MAHDIAFHAVTVAVRPADLAPLPGDVDLSRARLTAAKDVVAGDLVLGAVYDLPDGRRYVDYHTDAYPAAPIPNDPGCGCAGHQNLDDADFGKPLTVLTDGFPWDCCDVWPSDELVLIIPAAELPPVRKETRTRMRFTHNGVTCTVRPTPNAPGFWNVYADGTLLVTRRPTTAKAAADAKAVLDGDESRLTGFDKLNLLLTL